MGEEGTQNLITSFPSTGNQTKDLSLNVRAKKKKVQEHFKWAHTFTGNVTSDIFKPDVLNPAGFKISEGMLMYTSYIESFRVSKYIQESDKWTWGLLKGKYPSGGKTDGTCCQILFSALKHHSGMKTTRDKSLIHGTF